MNQDVLATLRAAAASAGPALRRGLWLSFLGPDGVEVAASGGADWLGVDLQHGDLDIGDVQVCCASPNARAFSADADAVP